MTASTSIVSVVIPVYRDGARAAKTASMILQQRLPAGRALEVVVVDDGSDDDTSAHLAACRDQRIRVLNLPRNEGRSAARNAGVASAHGDAVVFIDCDCVPMGDDFLAAHIAALSAGAVASTGQVDGNDNGFWSRYQEEASRRRRRQHAAGLTCSGSSQNLAVRRSAFEALGGFDTGYRRYGFEDRDLLLRLTALGPVAWTDGARVRHLDVLSLAQVVVKMKEAGEFSSARFSARHPAAYRSLGYDRLDCRRRKWLCCIARTGAPMVPPLASAADWLLRRKWLPYMPKALLVRGISGFAYLTGTSRGPAADNISQ